VSVFICDLYFVSDDIEKVKIDGLTAALRNSFQPSCSELTRHINGVMSNSCLHKKRVAVLISGSGMYVMMPVTVIHCLHLNSYRSQHVAGACLLLSVLRAAVCSC